MTVTDGRATRYYMTIGEASSLVLELAGMRPQGTYIFDMDSPISIGQLRDRFYAQSAAIFDWETIGLRPGEKMHEKLIYDSEKLEGTSHPRIKKVVL